MANTAISALTAATSIAGADLVPVVQGGTTKKSPASLIRQSGGSPHYWVSGRYYTKGGTPGSVTPTNGVIFYQPIDIPNDVTLTEACVNLTAAAASSVIRIGIYSNVNGVPATLLVEPTSATQIDSSTTGAKTATFSQAVTAGTWWLALVVQGSSAVAMSALAGDSSTIIGSTTAAGALGNQLVGYGNAGGNTTGALPGTADALASLSQGITTPRIALKTA